MTKLELLNVFLNDRLTAAADDIFRAVKDTVVEYQAELLRSKEENERLKRLLNAAVQRLLLQPDAVMYLGCTGESRAHAELRGPKESQSGQLPHNREPLEPEWRCAVEPVPQVKVEQKLRSPCSDVGRHSAEEACSGGAVLQKSGAQNIKTEREEPTATGPQLASNLHTQSPHSDCHASTADRTQKTQVSSPRDLLCSSGKTPGRQLKNPVRLLPPHSSGPGQRLQRWHSCKECGKGFSFACQLEVHMRWHTKEKPYCCTVCRKSFTTISMLKRHHRIHTGEKPFHCHVCGKRFNQSAHLNTHFRLHTRERASWNRVPLCK